MKNCTNCNELTTNNIMHTCGHSECVCDECLNVLENAHVENGEWTYNAQCTACYEMYNDLVAELKQAKIEEPIGIIGAMMTAFDVKHINKDVVDAIRQDYCLKGRLSLDNGANYIDIDDLHAHASEIVEKWDVITIVMDGDVRQRIHKDMAPCTELEFLAEYLRRADHNLIIP